MIRFLSLLLSSSLFVFPSLAYSAVDNASAARLGSDLTPVGAEKKGNGSDIPSWQGMARNEAHPNGEFHANPFATEKRVLSITKDNWQDHKDRLSAGTIKLLQRFPSMEIGVFPTHRTASYPQYVYDAIKDNATRAELLKYGSGVTGAVMSSPFPIPKNGLEVLWNHTLRFKGHSLAYDSSTVHVNSVGGRAIQTLNYEYYFAYSEVGLAPEDINNKIFFLKRKTIAPSSQAGRITLVHETLDQVQSPRKSWIYVPGQRRVRRIPNLAYDTPDVTTDSLRTIDQVDMFNGAPDYYDWTLVGKQEMYIPYNAYRLHDARLSLDDIAGPLHLSPQYLRYEAHRVWVVEANLRVGFNHRYAKRRYYFDEDSWSIVYAEEYDARGELWQFSESHTINYYDVPLLFSTIENTYDFTSNRYYVEGIDNERGKTYDYSVKLKRKDFTTSAVRREAKR